MDDLAIYEDILRLTRAGEAAVLATVVESSGSAPRKAGAKMLLRADGTLLGTIGGGRVEQAAVAAGRQVLQEGRGRTVAFDLTPENGMVCGGRVLLYLEPLNPPPQLVVVGAGHVGQALAGIARQTGFAITLVDPAGEGQRARVEGFAAPDLTCPAAEIFGHLSVDARTCIVIAAPSHEDDFAATRGALATQAGFVGVLGSRRKKQALFDFLRTAGCSDGDLERVVTPVGLDIGSQTPAEIAVSIVAQLVALRRNHAVPGCGADPGRREVAPDGAPQVAAALR